MKIGSKRKPRRVLHKAIHRGFYATILTVRQDTKMTSWLSENRTLLLRLFGTVVAIVLIVLLIRQEGWTEIVNSLKQISPVSFFLALASLLISRVFVVARWHVLLRSGGVKIPFSRSAELTLMGLFASHFLPTTIGGDVVRLAGVMQMGFDRAICLASIAADRLVGLAGMTRCSTPYSMSEGSCSSAALKNGSPGRNMNTNSGDDENWPQYCL